MSKRAYKNLQFFSEVVSADTDTIAIDMFTMDTAAFSVFVGTGLTTNISVMGSIDGTQYDDIGIIVEPTDGAADYTRLILVGPTAINHLKISFTGVSGSGQVSIKAAAKGYS